MSRKNRAKLLMCSYEMSLHLNHDTKKWNYKDVNGEEQQERTENRKKKGQETVTLKWVCYKRM
ncbi:unnamed protein product [Chironomus riparius]|uniref:Uncharacterized protein n=1 Tax=Chironomus riparius TaxID=315576 RepID=A0A9N9RQQ0_9DIPT|nr:unnamed protein product [Chironomus riparius]